MTTPEEQLEHDRNTALLDQELPDERFQDGQYLRWLYDENPAGPGIWDSTDEEDGVRVAHYALIPQTWRNADGPQPFVFSLNAVTHNRAQKSGYFKKIGDTIYDRAAAAGKKGIIAVPNANSTPAAIKYWKYEFLMQMPVRMVFPRPARGSESHWLDEQYRSSDAFAEVIADLDAHPADGWTCSYSPDYLRWRLAQPHARYSMHITEHVVGISARSDYRGFPITVIIKMLPRPGVDTTTTPVSGAPVVAAACRHHRTPVALYSGFNARVSLPGFELPLRVRPVPLNLIYKSLSDDVPQQGFRLDTYEFLDMDAF